MEGVGAELQVLPSALQLLPTPSPRATVTVTEEEVVL